MTTVEMVVRPTKATIRATAYLKKSSFVPVLIAVFLRSFGPSAKWPFLVSLFRRDWSNRCRSSYCP